MGFTILIITSVGSDYEQEGYDQDVELWMERQERLV